MMTEYFGFLKSDNIILKRENNAYCIFENKDDYTELFILQNKDTCVTLIELI